MKEVYVLLVTTRDCYPHIAGIFESLSEAIIEYNTFPMTNGKYYGEQVLKIYLFRRSVNVPISSGFINPIMERVP